MFSHSQSRASQMTQMPDVSRPYSAKHGSSRLYIYFMLSLIQGEKVWYSMRIVYQQTIHMEFQDLLLQRRGFFFFQNAVCCKTIGGDLRAIYSACLD